MLCDFRRVFAPTEEEKKQDEERLKKLWNDLKEKRNCLTCKKCVHVITYPGFVLGEEHECTDGLECDTILGTVINCEKYEEGNYEQEVRDNETIGRD